VNHRSQIGTTTQNRRVHVEFPNGLDLACQLFSSIIYRNDVVGGGRVERPSVCVDVAKNQDLFRAGYAHTRVALGEWPDSSSGQDAMNSCKS